MIRLLFFFNDTATTEIYTLSLHDALPIFTLVAALALGRPLDAEDVSRLQQLVASRADFPPRPDFFEVFARSLTRSEEHTSELQSRQYLVCRLLLEKKKTSSD